VAEARQLQLVLRGILGGFSRAIRRASAINPIRQFDELRQDRLQFSYSTTIPHRRAGGSFAFVVKLAERCERCLRRSQSPAVCLNNQLIFLLSPCRFAGGPFFSRFPIAPPSQ
jgi:hypothetical protein